jgi:Sigma-70, region 4
MRPHGTWHRYSNGCRCNECREAWNAHHRAYMRERRAKYRAEHPPKPHHRKVPKTEHPAIIERAFRGETLQAIADSYGLTRERIRQILVSADPAFTAGRKHALAEIDRLRTEIRTLRAALDAAGGS